MKTRTAVRLGAALFGGLAALLLVVATLAAPPPGPPFPDPVENQAVYDYAGIFSEEGVAAAEAKIDEIEARTGVEVAVYTQVKPQSDTTEEANADALALMNEWGVGRRGFDDGLVIMFDMEDNRIHGQVALYAGAGFMAAYLSNSDRQAIYEDDMLPLLKLQEWDRALAIALQRVDEAATPEHAAALNQARLVNAAVGIGILALAIWLIAFVLVSWYTHGRDPVYTDSPSVLMPAPPPGLTPAMATLLMDNRTSTRTVSAGFVDLAARGLVRFYKEGSGKHSVGIGAVKGSVPLAFPEQRLVQALQSHRPAIARFFSFIRKQPRFTPAGFVSSEGVPADPTLASYIDPASMSTLASDVSKFKSSLEAAAVDSRWMSGQPSKVQGKWFGLAFLLFLPIIPLMSWSAGLGASGGNLGAGALGAAGIVTAAVAFFMPARTMTGSLLRAQLLAYKRTMKATLAQASSMDEVVERRPLPWVETPDQAMAWGIALGLNDEVDEVMKRTAVSSTAAGAATGWHPSWWVSGSGPGGSGFAGAAGAGGLYSSGAIPDIGGMMSTLGSIGSSTSSSGGGGGGFGGGGGGGGGGAGGGF